MAADVEKLRVRKLSPLSTGRQQSRLSDLSPLRILSNNNILETKADADYGSDFESDEEESGSFNDDIEDLLTGLDETENKISKKACTLNWVK